ncbi:MAG: GrdX protein [Treponema sp.]|nr:MAG: GrdX protein [Treponema sp.]
MIEKAKLIITNNPKVKRFYDNQPLENKNEVSFLFCESREEVFRQVRDYVHKNWKLLNHAMAGNIPLHKHPYRSMALQKQDSLDSQSLMLWENAMERVTRGRLPNYTDEVLSDFQDLDYILFTDNIKIM